MQLKVHYYRYDQDYSGWDLWLWPKGSDGTAYPLDGIAGFPGHPESSMRYADVDITDFPVPELGLILRHNGWNGRDWDSDRYVNLVAFPSNREPEIFLVQNSEQIHLSPDRISIIPTAERAVFRNFREIFIQMQAPCQLDPNDPFLVTGDGNVRPVAASAALEGGRAFILTLQRDWILGETCIIRKKGFLTFPARYGALYDTPEFENLYAYDGNDLGCRPSSDGTFFRVWSPMASRVDVNIFCKSDSEKPDAVIPLSPDRNGTWILTVPEDLSGCHYTYNVTTGGDLQEVCDPNAIGVSINGKRALATRPREADPAGWESVGHLTPGHPTDAVLYEVHIRDFTIHPDSGILRKGLFLGLAEPDTHTPDGTKTGLAHLVELGVTHVHLMPIFDFYTIDESRLHEGRFNWGYDPHLYNVPDGSYTTDPDDGLDRIRQLKKMILALKTNGIGVVMDVVYNHTYRSIDSEFNKLVPGYFYRADSKGRFSNGSGCGNETASERYMVRKTITDSVLYWAREYKVDGFRFDLMGLHDIETMNGIRRALDAYHPGILMYGEGWTGGESLLDKGRAALKANAARLLQVGFFNDNTRDAIKGNSFVDQAGGFINGQPQFREGVKFGITGAVSHPQVDLAKAIGSGPAWAGYPWHCVNYAASHDNLTLYDKLAASHAADTVNEAIRRTNMAGSIVLTAQGIPFMLSGTEFMRSKNGLHNSYNAPDEANQVDWNRKSLYRACFAYHQGLIRLRKAHPAFRLVSSEEVRRNLFFLHTPTHIIAYLLRNGAGGDAWPVILVAFNAGSLPETVMLPFAADWHIVVDDMTAGCEDLRTAAGSSLTVPGISTLVAWCSPPPAKI
jgi:pullulanase